MGYEQYYVRQTGNDIVGFSGVRYQKGDGFFGRLISGAFLPWIKTSLGFLGKNAIKAGVNIGSDLLETGDFSKDIIKEISKKRLTEQGKKIANSMIESIGSQSGSGIGNKRKKTKVTKVKKNVKKVVKTKKGKVKKKPKQKKNNKRKTTNKKILA